MQHFSSADLRGAAQLATDATAGVTDLVEAVHAAIARLFSRHPRPQRTRGLTGLVYRIVRSVTRRTGWAADVALRTLGEQSDPPIAHPARAAAVAALNGVLGDTLAARGNPLATPLHLRHAGRRLPLDADALARAVCAPSATLLVHVHGLCMHAGQWGDDQHDPREVLADGLGATRLALRYNSGRRIAENGRGFAEALHRVVTAWPQPVQRIVVVGHSMGGLVARSAFFHAERAGHAWPMRDAALVTLGTPHHGAPLERLGVKIDRLLEVTRYTAPFARIGRVRSAGINDLCHARLRDQDGDESRREPLPSPPLPDAAACYLVAGTTEQNGSGVRTRLWNRAVGDGLVPVHSALGCHHDPARALHVPPGHRLLLRGRTHFDLLRDPAMTAQLLAWLRPARS